MKIPAKYFFTGIWLALLVLLFGMFGLAHLHLKSEALVILPLAGLEMVLVLLFFMRLRSSTRLIRLVAAVGYVWLLILFILAFSDYLTRQWH